MFWQLSGQWFDGAGKGRLVFLLKLDSIFSAG